MPPIEIKNILADRYSNSELDTLCFNLGINYETITGRHTTRDAYALSIVQYCMRHSKFDVLVKQVEQDRYIRIDLNNTQFNPVEEPYNNKKDILKKLAQIRQLWDEIEGMI